MNLSYSLPSELTLKIAETPEELKQAFEVLHETYLERKLINKSDEGLRVTKYHALPCTTMIIAKWKDEVIGTLSFIVDNPIGLPLEELWDLSHLRKQGLRLAEISSFGIKRPAPMERRDLIFPLFRTMVQYSRECNRVDGFLLATNPRVKDFYAACFGAVPLDHQVKEYAFVKNAKAFAQFIDARPYQLKEWGRFQYENKTKNKNLFKYVYGDELNAWTQLPKREYFKAMDPAMTLDLLNYFFKEKTDILNHLSEKELEIFRNCYHFEEFEQVFGGNKNLYKFIKRDEARYSVYCLGRLVHPDDNRITNFRVKDVSRDGLQIQSRSPLPLGEVYTLQIKVGETRFVKIKAKSQWQGEACNYGFKITNSSANNWNNFINYLESDLRKNKKISEVKTS